MAAFRRRSGTIFAPASGSGAAITLLRLSGEDAGMLVQRLCGRLPPPRRATLRRLEDEEGALLDRALVVWMPGPGTYTGEDVAEFSLHGGRAVLEAVSDALLRLGARPAEPGEFTRRAFQAGRMDLLEAEAVGDLVAAETQGQRRAALRQLEGAPGRMLSAWADRLRRALAFQEALLDFPDETLPDAVEAGLVGDLAALAGELAGNAAAASRIARQREGLVIAIVGPPNAGKSSLMNALARRDVAIVAATPGTTRDAVEAVVTVAGARMTLIDTAGLRETDDPVEAEGVRRAIERAASADLILHVTEAGCQEPMEFVRSTDEQTLLLIASKTDLAAPQAGALGVSVRTASGLEDLEAFIVAYTEQNGTGASGCGFSHARHAAALRECEAAVGRAVVAQEAELRAEELRLAMAALGHITGEVENEAVLDTIFSSFCIGK